MPNIKEVTFYFATPLQDHNGEPVLSESPESHTLTWSQVQSNAGFSLSTGESMFTELPDQSNDHKLRIVNGFYFGSGRFGSLLAIQYHYDDGTEGWINKVHYKSENSQNIDMITGNWIQGLSYQEIINHPNWIGKPYIGFENDYIDVEIKMVLPDMFLSLEPQQKTVTKGDSITFSYSTIDYCEGEVAYEWIYDKNAIEELSLNQDVHILQFKRAGTYTVKVIATSNCGQETSKESIITVEEPENIPCDIQLTPQIITIRMGESVTFHAIHPYSGTGSWSYDTSMDVLNETSKLLQVKPKALGSYAISYRINECQSNALLYVLEPIPDGEWEDPAEPPPPPLPNTPPDAVEVPNLAIELMDASIPIQPLYKYPNIMKRNARYRGHRESEKFLSDHQEQFYDIRQIHKIIELLQNMEAEAISSWFLENSNIPMKIKEISQNKEEVDKNSEVTKDSQIRAFEGNVLQSSGNQLKERITGVYGIKRRMQEIDERIAEAERRYSSYENAYK